MPIHRIVEIQHTREELLRTLVPVVFQIHDGALRLYGLPGTLEDLHSHPFDVDFEHMTCREIETVQRYETHGLAVRDVDQRYTAEVHACGGIHCRYDNGAEFGAHRFLPGENIGALVEREIGA